MEAAIFLDESGDLGWKFHAPYRKGGSSNHLTIGAIVIPFNKLHLPSRLIKNLYMKFSWDPKIERKWAHMREEEKLLFAKEAKELISKNEEIKYFSITAYKPRVELHIRKDPNKLYNYLIKLLLLNEMARYKKVHFFPDSRQIKVASGSSLRDYLQTELYFRKNVSTELKSKPQNSASNKGIQFVDMLSGLVQNHHEDNNSKPYKILASSIQSKLLFFPNERLNKGADVTILDELKKVKNQAAKGRVRFLENVNIATIDS